MKILTTKMLSCILNFYGYIWTFSYYIKTEIFIDNNFLRSFLHVLEISVPHAHICQLLVYASLIFYI
jgi:hypothetical protein